MNRTASMRFSSTSTSTGTNGKKYRVSENTKNIILNAHIEPSYIYDVKDSLRDRDCYKKTAKVLETMSKIFIAFGGILSFSSGYYGNQHLAFASGSVSTISLALLQISGFCYKEAKKNQDNVNRILDQLGIESLPDQTYALTDGQMTEAPYVSPTSPPTYASSIYAKRGNVYPPPYSSMTPTITPEQMKQMQVQQVSQVAQVAQVPHPPQVVHAHQAHGSSVKNTPTPSVSINSSASDANASDANASDAATTSDPHPARPILLMSNGKNVLSTRGPGADILDETLVRQHGVNDPLIGDISIYNVFTHKRFMDETFMEQRSWQRDENGDFRRDPVTGNLFVQESCETIAKHIHLITKDWMPCLKQIAEDHLDAKLINPFTNKRFIDETPFDRVEWTMTDDGPIKEPTLDKCIKDMTCHEIVTYYS